jgi:hypothetical protein
MREANSDFNRWAKKGNWKGGGHVYANSFQFSGNKKNCRIRIKEARSLTASARDQGIIAHDHIKPALLSSDDLLTNHYQTSRSINLGQNRLSFAPG